MPTIEERALALVDEVKGCEKWFWTTRSTPSVEALCREIEAHDATLAEFGAFKREVSRRIEAFRSAWQHRTPCRDSFDAVFDRFILPKPVDPLEEVQSLIDEGLTLEEAVVSLGLKLVEVGDAD